MSSSRARRLVPDSWAHERIHDVEIDTSEPVVRALLGSQCPHITVAGLAPVASAGTSNALWRLTSATGMESVVRLPRTAGAAESLTVELAVLPLLQGTAPQALCALPEVLHVGEPNDTFGYPWGVLNWIAGRDAWQARSGLDVDGIEFANDVANVVMAIRGLDLGIAERPEGDRGGSVEALLRRLDHWLDDPVWHADDLLDTAAVRRCAAASAEASGDRVDRCVVHGDLIAPNLLTNDGRLAAVIDWGSVARADPAQDIEPLWALFDGDARQAFCSALQIDDATRLRAQAFALEHAVGGILYYRPRGHPLAEVMQRTLDRILVDNGAAPT